MARARHPRAGFTLVELLIVIVIIAILIGILIPTIGSVMKAGKNFADSTNLKNLDAALVAYKEKYSDFPPDFTDCFTASGTPFKPWTSTVAYLHLRKVFPRIAQDDLVLMGLLCMRELNDPLRIDPAEAIVFWLGGFSKNPKFPITGPGGPIVVGQGFNAANPDFTLLAWNPDRNEPLFDFPSARRGPDPDVDVATALRDIRLGPTFLQNIDTRTPYVYFDSRTYAAPSAIYPTPAHSVPAWGFVRPYFSFRNKKFVEPDTYQLISAGADGAFGVDFGVCGSNNLPFYVSFPEAQIFHTDATCLSNMQAQIDSGQVPDPFQTLADNLTQFSEGQTLGDARP